jgi:hypothetical protein
VRKDHCPYLRFNLNFDIVSKFDPFDSTTLNYQADKIYHFLIGFHDEKVATILYIDEFELLDDNRTPSTDAEVIMNLLIMLTMVTKDAILNL